MTAPPAPPEPEQVRAELAAWVAEHWDPGMPLHDWRTLLLTAGWAVPSWPQRWHGRGWPAWTDELVGSELIRLGTAGVPVGSGTWLAAPTILAHGSDELRDRLLTPDPHRRADLVPAVQRARRRIGPGRPVHLGRARRRQLGDQRPEGLEHQRAPRGHGHAAGPHRSPASRSTRASRTSRCRCTSPASRFGQLRQMNFHASFNEVFLTDARIPRDNVIGGVGQGWTAALTTLAYERRFSALRRPDYSPAPGRALDEARAEADDYFATYSWYPQRAGRPDLVVEHARAAGVSGRSGHPAGHRPPHHHAAGQRLDGRARPGSAGTWRTTRCRGIHRQARCQQHRPRVRQGARHDRRRGSAADRA